MKNTRTHINNVERLGDSISIRRRHRDSETARLVHINKRHLEDVPKVEDTTPGKPERDVPLSIEEMNKKYLGRK